MSRRLYYRGPAKSGDEAEERFDNAIRSGYLFTIDTETVSLKDRSCIGIGIQAGPVDTYYFPIYPESSDILYKAFLAISNPDLTKLYFNCMFDIRTLEESADELGYPIPDLSNLEDASILAQVLGIQDSLEDLSQILLHESNDLSISQLLFEAGPKSTMLDVPEHLIAQKCMNDVWYTWKVWEHMQSMGTEGTRDCYVVDRDLIKLLREVESRGLALNKDILSYHNFVLNEEVQECLNECMGHGFNPSSPRQVGHILASRGIILPFTKTGRSLRTDEDTLSSIDDDLAKLILKFRKANKLLTTYVTPWINDDRAYTHFRMDLATGRLASYDRNLQNIPPKMRDIFSPDNTVFSWMDFSQIEMRVFAYMSRDPAMLSAYQGGRDIHAMTQLALWPGSDIKDESKRIVAKTFNFAMIYNALPQTLATNTKLPLETCIDFRNRWLALYSGGKKFMEDRLSADSDYVTSEFGRRMKLPDSFDLTWNHINKCKINYPVQGTAADIIKRAMLKIADSDLRLQVHDELVVDGEYEFPEELSKIHPDIPTPFSSYHERAWR